MEITLFPPITKKTLFKTEVEISYNLPDIFRHFYTTESNGLKIHNKVIYSISENKKETDNLQIANTPSISHWFKHYPKTFNDYFIIGYYNEVCYTLDKHNLDYNPPIFICKNPNSKSQIIIEKMGLNLADFIYKIAKN
ncbi:conserved hypothetical protein [Tenacibaculum maritimum]|uniref:SMI1/KNR4 family protein n=1 Tax=Tenacibaculum maritimum TaxID=107401 RepID=UPI0012E6058A|nr:SMI1/KNR4 family protein [Tenacibaculum maritimum]CAA0176578.1 conserved hypothetical protein [Tenacibaculum maritimum]